MSGVEGLQVPLAAGQPDIARLSEIPADTLVVLLKTWIPARLQGSDPYVAFPHDDSETPWSLFVHLWHQSAPADGLHQALGLALEALLRMMVAGPPEPWHRGLLTFVAQTLPARGWQLLREHAGTLLRRRSPLTELDREWLRATAMYANQGDLVEAWVRALKQNGLSQIAWTALSHDIEQAVGVLPEYAEACVAQSQAFLVEWALEDLLDRDLAVAKRVLLWRMDHSDRFEALSELIRDALDARGLADACPLPRPATGDTSRYAGLAAAAR